MEEQAAQRRRTADTPRTNSARVAAEPPQQAVPGREIEKVHALLLFVLLSLLFREEQDCLTRRMNAKTPEKLEETAREISI